MTTAEPVDVPTTSGQISYMTEVSESSLFRNGKVFTRRDLDGSDDSYVGVDAEELTVSIGDARCLTGEERRTIGTHGFELLDQPLADPAIDFYDHQAVVQRHYPECAEAVRAATGASHVFAFDHNIRSAAENKAARRIKGGQQVQGPAHLVHGDYTLTSGPQRLRDLAKPPGLNDTVRSVLAQGEALLDQAVVDRALGADGRFAIINLWRNIDSEPVQSEAMTLCDGQTVIPEDLVVFEIHYQERIGENYFAKPAPGHGWWWYPHMTRDEGLLIKQWDSAGAMARSDGARADSSAGGEAPCTFSFHTAFKDPATPPDARDRKSIEVRCIVLYD
ncbi:MAG: hypothetical protein HOI34_06500 [Rhodospirillaceae bacterium]|nr:hypothetical protein [Rhodospirillaceae bacterium]MBT6510705.1 hypothetical protein [Rhodospirillaceae bacterium]